MAYEVRVGGGWVGWYIYEVRVGSRCLGWVGWYRLPMK